MNEAMIYALTPEQHAQIVDALEAMQSEAAARNCGLRICDEALAMLKGLKPVEPCGNIVSIDGWKANTPANRMATFHGDIPDEGAQLYLAAGAQAQPLTAQQLEDLANQHYPSMTHYTSFARAIEAAHKIGGSV